MHPVRTIAYEESPLRGGLSIERGGGAVRVLVPASRDWRHLPRPAAGAIVAMALIALLFVTAGLINWHSDDRDALFINGALYTVVLGLILLAAHQRLYRTLIFELTAEALTLTAVAPAGERSIRVWRREELAGVTVHGGNGNLILRLRGNETVELFAGSRQTVDTIAAALSDALATLDPLPQPPTPALIAPHAKADALPTARLRKLLWWGCGFLLAVAALFLLTGHACGAAYVLLLAAAPAALAVGMGERDVYL
jgi:hypothetical protein